jgi:PAS domain S-box-containing protein
MNPEVERSRNAVIETLREKEHHYKNILESLTVAVYSCDMHGYITFYNKAAAELWGHEPRIGRDVWTGALKIYDSNGERLIPEACPMAISMNEGVAASGVEIIIERPDGSRKTVISHPHLFFDEDGKVNGGINMLVDITAQKESEIALKNITEKENDLRQSNSALMQINRELEQFAYITSHDLQEPVRKIQVLSERLRERNKMLLDEISFDYVDKIKLAANRMQTLINDVLSFSRMANQSNLFAKTNLHDIYKSVLEDFELRIEQKNAVVSCSELPDAEVIPLQMRQLFYNIIGNSLKYTMNGQTPVIQTSARVVSEKEVLELKLDEKRKYFVIIFKDNGVGFN